jgi:N-acetyl-gamma-glutamyl-phosphate reductase
MKKIKVGIVGGAGYTGGELIRLLVNHDQAEIVYVHSKSKSNKYIYQVHTDLIGEIDLKFRINKSAKLTGVANIFISISLGT